MRYSTCITTRRRSDRSGSGGRSNRTPALLMLSLARLMRWAIVASGTRNAFAISAVVSPPTARRVRASCEGTESEGWQHMNRSVSVSSWAEGCPLTGSSRANALLSTPPRALAAPLVDQAAGRDGPQPRSRIVWHAFLRPLQRCGEECLLHRVLTRVELPVAPHERAEDLRRKLAQQVLDSGFRSQKSGGASITRRTSMGTLTKATMREAISTARASLSTSTIQ